MVLGVCSWSLRPTSPSDLVEKVQATGIEALQLHLDPLRTGAFDERATVEQCAFAGIRLVSGMMTMKGEDYSTMDSIRVTGGVRPDATWDENRRAAVDNARLARRLGMRLVTLHAGFLPDEPDDPERAVMMERLRTLVDIFAAEDVVLGFETGQETAETLLEALAELRRPSAGVNFDPANMILYGMGDPVNAVRMLAPHVRQVHVKDAVSSRLAGTWGEEVPVGRGEVDWRAFFDALRAERLTVDLMIEREAGSDRIGDIRTARTLVRDLGRWS